MPEGNSACFEDVTATDVEFLWPLGSHGLQYIYGLVGFGSAEVCWNLENPKRYFILDPALCRSIDNISLKSVYLS